MFLKDDEQGPLEGKDEILADVPCKTVPEIKANDSMECLDLDKDSNSLVTSIDKEIICKSPDVNDDLVIYDENTGNVVKPAEPLSPFEKRSLILMNRLWNYLPELQDFTLFRKIGEGTFSSVYLACLKGNPEKKYAIKHHVPTSLPSRIAWEMKCLKDIGGVDNVAGIETAFRRNDCTVFVMPYMPHARFSEYVQTMGVSETREYLRNLLMALARVHSFGVIHRDVKPSNYLYDRQARKYMLVDFGLSCLSLEPELDSKPTPTTTTTTAKRKRDDSPIIAPSKRRALQTQPNGGGPPRKATNSRPVALDSNDHIAAVKKVNGQSPVSKKLANRSPAAKRLANQGRAAKKVTNQSFPVQKSGSGSFVWAKPGNGSKLSAISNNETASPRRELGGVRKKLFPMRTETNGGSRFTEQSTNPTQGQKGCTLSGSKENHADATLPATTQTLRKTVLGNVDGNAVGSPTTNGNRFTALAEGTTSGARHVRVQDSKSQTLPASDEQSPACNCYGKGRVCTTCLSRPGRYVPRAGTPGFRPPEVLFKYPHQTTAVDVWAAGVVLLCVMSGCYPFFKSPNDMAALAEITVVFGSDKVKEIASKLGRQVMFSATKRPLSIRRLCESLRSRCRRPPSPSPPPPVCPDCMQYCHPMEGCLCGPEPETPAPDNDDDVFPQSAYDLLAQLMDLNPFSRISAAEALKHPFFAAPAPSEKVEL